MAAPAQPKAVADLIAESLSAEKPDTVRSLFNAEGAREPEIHWSPRDPELRNPLLRQFAEVCHRYEKNGKIAADAIRLEDFGGLTEWLMLLEPVEEGADFQYLSYGSSIAESYGTDMTGRRTSEFGGHISMFFLGLYRAVLKRDEAVYSEHEPPARVFVRAWHRLIIPLHDDAGAVVRLIVLNVPDNELRAGLELIVDPVFVLRADKTVAYANRAAQHLFKLSANNHYDSSFETVTGMTIDTPLTPDQMLSQHKVEDSVQLTIREAIVERLVMTVSAAQHRGDAFYVVVMRLIGT
ncbi:MAG: hypothetical protein QNJ35_10490 [Paracoccaceae bacterium]|nr:hypothetical protein [Paracoccaceae bacterium]